MSLDLSQFKIYVDYRRIYPFNNFIPHGDIVMLEFLKKTKWLFKFITSIISYPTLMCDTTSYKNYYLFF